MKKYIIIGLLLTTTILYCGTSTILGKEQGKKPPVDEGVENRPKEDKVKGVSFATDKKVATLKIYLSKEKDTISIKFEKVSRVPFVCKIIRNNKTVWSSEPKKPQNPRKSRTLEFQIDKSKLQVGDRIEIINRRKKIVGKVLVER